VSEVFQGKYELIEPLGEGGMASVWLAKVRGSAGFERTCVIKRILAGPDADLDQIALFVREARLCARLNHRNIVQVFDFGKAGGEYFMAMEYVEGFNLLEIVRLLAGELPPPGMCAFVVRELCRALAYAHGLRDESGAELGLVHRDVSLSNVIVAYDGSVKLVDFGIAKAMSLGTIVSRAGAVKGKLAYMSPEQVGGELVDARADIFAAGVVLHEILCLRRLFRGDEDEETLRNILEMEIPLPSQRRPGLSTDFDAICLRALERDVDRRYARAADMAAALDPVVRELGWDAERLAGWLENLGAKPAMPLPVQAPPTVDSAERAATIPEEEAAARSASSGEVVAVAPARSRGRPGVPPPYSPLAIAILLVAVIVAVIVLSR
jgi:serine/threonine protein kinase